MQQWIAKIAYDSKFGTKVKTETFYLPTQDEVRKTVKKNGGYVLTIRPYERTPLERLIARSSWWQVQLLRGIQFRSTATSPGVALWNIYKQKQIPLGKIY